MACTGNTSHWGGPEVTVNAWVVSLALSSVVAVMAGVSPRPGNSPLTVIVDKNTNFSALHTYAWTRGWGAFDARIDAHVVAAIDRELVSAGLSKRESEPADVVVNYGTVQRSDVDVHRKRGRDSGAYPEYPVGTLVVLMREASSRRELLRARASLDVDSDVGRLEQQIDTVLARIFARYPTAVSDRP
jgi:hypothetical protein